MFTAAKDALASQAARSYANGLIKAYGEVRELKIDSKEKTVEVLCDLNGEHEPVRLRVDEYQIENKAGKSYIRVKAVSCSRPWLQAALRDHACNRSFELPSWAAAAL